MSETERGVENSPRTPQKGEQGKWSRTKRGLAIAGSILAVGGAVDVAEGGGLDKVGAVGDGGVGISKKAFETADEFINDTYRERKDRFVEGLKKDAERERLKDTVAGDKKSKEIDTKIEFIGYIDKSNLEKEYKNKALEVIVFSEVEIADENKVYNPKMTSMLRTIDNPTEDLNEDYFYGRIPSQIPDPETGKMVDLSDDEREKRAELIVQVVQSDLGSPMKSTLMVQAMDSVNFSLNKMDAPDTER